MTVFASGCSYNIVAMKKQAQQKKRQKPHKIRIFGVSVLYVALKET